MTSLSAVDVTYGLTNKPSFSLSSNLMFESLHVPTSEWRANASLCFDNICLSSALPLLLSLELVSVMSLSRISSSVMVSLGSSASRNGYNSNFLRQISCLSIKPLQGKNLHFCLSMVGSLKLFRYSLPNSCSGSLYIKPKSLVFMCPIDIWFDKCIGFDVTLATLSMVVPFLSLTRQWAGATLLKCGVAEMIKSLDLIAAGTLAFTMM